MRYLLILSLTALLLVFPQRSPAQGGGADKTKHGLKGEYFADRSFDVLATTRLDPVIDFTWGKEPPYKEGKLPNRWTDNLKQSWYVHFAVRWTGYVVPKHSEEYTFSVKVDDGAMLWINDQLVISAWKEQGPTEYSGRIRLTAGKPARIKLLYFNAWFAGSIKLSWASPSQAQEVIPASQLLPPEPDSELPAGPVPSLAKAIRTDTIVLPAPVRYAPRGGWGVRPNLVLVPLADGSSRLGWNDQTGAAHISTLNPAFQVSGRDIVLPKLDLRGLVVHTDGSLGVLAAELPFRMWALRLGPNGQELHRTVLTGAKGKVLHERYLDKLWSFTGRLATSGTEDAAHFAHVWQTDPTVAHQGGYFALVDRTGKKRVENAWTVSHSLDQRLLYHRGNFFTMSLGDAFPRGIHFENRTFGGGRVVYPPKAAAKQWDPGGAALGGLAPAGRNIALAFLSREGKSRDIFVVLVDEESCLLRSQKLALPPNPDRQAVRLAPFGRHLLLAWQDKTGTHLAVCSYRGDLLNQPVTVSALLAGNDDLIVFPNGDVGWLAAQDGQRQVTLVRVRL